MEEQVDGGVAAASCRGLSLTALRLAGKALLIVWYCLLTVVLLIAKLVPARRGDISREVVLVTNSGRGLGRRLAVRFGMEAGMVVCWDPDRERCMNTVYEIRHRGGSAVGYEVDVSDEAAVVAAAARLRRDVGAVRVLVLNAGRAPMRALLRFTVPELEALFRTNVFPHFVLLKVFVPPMVLANLGHIVCICSASGIIPSACEGPYVASKMAVSGMMRALREELDALPANKVRVTRVYPYLSRLRVHDGTIYNLRWSQRALDIMAGHIVDGVLLGRDSICVPRCLVFWMHILKVLPFNIQRRWRRLFYRRLLEAPVVPHPPHADVEACPWSSEYYCPLGWMGFLEGKTLPRTDPEPAPFEMVSERSTSREVLRVGFKKPCRINLD